MCITSNILAYAPWSVLYSWVSFWKSNLGTVKAEFCKREILANSGICWGTWAESFGELNLESLKRLNLFSFLWKTSDLSNVYLQVWKVPQPTRRGKAEPTASTCSLSEPLWAEPLAGLHPDIFLRLNPALWWKDWSRLPLASLVIVGRCPAVEGPREREGERSAPQQPGSSPGSQQVLGRSEAEGWWQLPSFPSTCHWTTCTSSPCFEQFSRWF